MWWPFGKKKKAEAAETEQQFKHMLHEALLRQDDLRAAVERMKESRERRQQEALSTARPKLNSQTG